MKRKRVNRTRDRRVFAKTADKTKKINIVPYVMRGGIRL